MKKKSHGKFFAYMGLFIVLIAVVLSGNNIIDRTETFYNKDVSSKNTAVPIEADKTSIPSSNNPTEPVNNSTDPANSPTATVNNPIDSSTPAPINFDMDSINRCSTTIINWSYGQYTGSKDENGVEKMEYFLNKKNNALLVKYNGIGRLSEDNKNVYLTFDEGYENGHTAKILDTLKANGVKAVFFVTGEYVDTNPDLVRRMYNEGHIIGNHTNSHPADGMSTLTTEKFISDLQAVEKKVRNTLGTNYKMKYYRPPEGIFCERDLEIAKQMGYQTVLWSFAYSDWSSEKSATPEYQKYAFGRITQSLHNGEVFLLHAVSETNATVLEKVISYIRSQGYNIKLLSES